jgi:hypothetical protein
MCWDEGDLVVRLQIVLEVFEVGEIWIFVRPRVVETKLFLSLGRHLDTAQSSFWKV